MIAKIGLFLGKNRILVCKKQDPGIIEEHALFIICTDAFILWPDAGALRKVSFQVCGTLYVRHDDQVEAGPYHAIRFSRRHDL